MLIYVRTCEFVFLSFLHVHLCTCLRVHDCIHVKSRAIFWGSFIAVSLKLSEDIW